MAAKLEITNNRHYEKMREILQLINKHDEVMIKSCIDLGMTQKETQNQIINSPYRNALCDHYASLLCALPDVRWVVGSEEVVE